MNLSLKILFQGASRFEKEMAAEIVGRISPNHEPQIIEEDAEPEEFWNAIGGKGDYDKELDKPGPPFLESRLFHCKILANGKFRVEEVHHYEQEDMDVDDIMVLDGGDEIYVWEGDGSTEEEKSKSLEMANVSPLDVRLTITNNSNIFFLCFYVQLYIRKDPSERSEETVPVIKIHQGHEPRSFKRLFPAWEDSIWEVSRGM